MSKLASIPIILIFVNDALFQNIGLITMSMLFTVYLSITRPFLQTVQNVIAILCEVTTLIVFMLTFGITLVEDEPYN